MAKRTGVPSRWVVVGLLAVGNAACSAGEQPRVRAVVRDSAGITIVENSVPLWRDEEEWRLTAEPVVQIGVVMGAPEYQLHNVVGATRLADGRIAVANGSSGEIRLYDPSGRFISLAGRPGEGPGEFGSLGMLFRLGDSLVAYDYQLRRLSIFDDEGTFARSFTLEVPPGRSGLSPRGALADRTLLVSTIRIFVHDEAKPGVSRDTALYLRYDFDGALVDSIGRFPGVQHLVRVNGEAMSVSSLPFGSRASTAIGGSGFFYGASDSYEIRRYAADGTLEMLIRRLVEPRRVTPEDVSGYKEQVLTAVGPRNRQAAERMLAEIPFPETMPAFAQLQVDAAGNLWVEEYRSPADRHPPRWTIFDPTGQMLGTIETPDRFTIFEIGEDYVLGRWIDNFDIEYVRLYGLIKP